MPLRQRAALVLDPLVFSGLGPACVAAGLVLACARALSSGAAPSTPTTASMALAAAGTFVVYNVDRLRDVERDRTSAPARSRFVERHRRALLVSSAAAALLCLPLALQHPPGVWGICAVVLALGLAHRRLKGASSFKIVYVTVAWLAIVVGLPWLSGPPDTGSLRELAAVLAAIGLPIAGNVIASELRGGSHDPAASPALRVARALAAAGLAMALLGGGRSAALAAIPAAEGLALLGFRDDERFGLVVLDGALLVGALVAAMLLGGD